MALPMEPFPARIVGICKPQGLLRDSPSSSLSNPNQVDDGGFDDCDTVFARDANGYYANDSLPKGFQPVRYRWVAQHAPFDSEMCGMRNYNNQFLRWRQMFYAINTAHWQQDPALDYPFTPLGRLVMMAFGPIGLIPGDKPKYGFFFHHPTDPVGIRFCRNNGGGGGDPCGCCYLQPIGSDFVCLNQVACLGLGGVWVAGAGTCGGTNCTATC